MAFKGDLERAQKKEDEIIQRMLERKIRPIFKPVKEDRKFFDIKARDVKYEVKEDKKFTQTGNVAIELSKKCKDGLSGLSITQSEYYIYFLGSMIRVIDTTLLKKYCQERNYKRVWGGDYNNTLLLLYPLQNFLNDTICFREYLNEQ